MPIFQSLLLFLSGVSFTIILELLAIEELLAPLRGLFETILGLRGV